MGQQVEIAWSDFQLTAEQLVLVWGLLPYVLLPSPRIMLPDPGTWLSHAAVLSLLTRSLQAVRQSGMALPSGGTRAARTGGTAARPVPTRTMRGAGTAMTDSPARGRPARTMLKTKGG